MLSVMAVVVGATMLVGTAFLLVSNWWIHRDGRNWHSYEALTDVPARDVAIVPGVGDRNGQVRDRLRARLLAGLALYRAHKVKAILVSGVGGRPGDEVTSSRAWLLARGVDPAHVMTDPAGFRTLDTMQRAVKTFGVTSAIVCSQAQHMDRTLFLARAAGLDAVGFVAELRVPVTNFEVRLETLKAALAVADTYVLRTGPKVTGPVARPAGLVASTP